MKLKPYPKPGDRRIKSRFAWLPVELSSGVVIWLERYTVVEKYVAGRADSGWDAISIH